MELLLCQMKLIMIYLQCENYNTLQRLHKKKHKKMKPICQNTPNCKSTFIYVPGNHTTYPCYSSKANKNWYNFKLTHCLFIIAARLNFSCSEGKSLSQEKTSLNLSQKLKIKTLICRTKTYLNLVSKTHQTNILNNICISPGKYYSHQISLFRKQTVIQALIIYEITLKWYSNHLKTTYYYVTFYSVQLFRHLKVGQSTPVTPARSPPSSPTKTTPQAQSATALMTARTPRTTSARSSQTWARAQSLTNMTDNMTLSRSVFPLQLRSP